MCWCLPTPGQDQPSTGALAYSNHQLQKLIVMLMVILIIVPTVKRNIFRLRASDADDDYPLKFSIQGKTNPYFIAQAAGSLQISLSVHCTVYMSNTS